MGAVSQPCCRVDAAVLSRARERFAVGFAELLPNLALLETLHRFKVHPHNEVLPVHRCHFTMELRSQCPRERGLRVLKTGVVDTPPYPDSLGFRDMKLHRMNVDLDKIDWESRTIGWMKEGRYPPKLKFLYFFEWLPLPWVIKLAYAHLFFVLAEAHRGENGEQTEALVAVLTRART